MQDSTCSALILIPLTKKISSFKKEETDKIEAISFIIVTNTWANKLLSKYDGSLNWQPFFFS